MKLAEQRLKFDPAYLAGLLSSWVISRFLDHQKLPVKSRIIYRYSKHKQHKNAEF